MHLVSLAIATNLQAKSIVNALGVSPFLAQYAFKIFSTTSGDNSADSELRSPIATPAFTAIRAAAASSTRRAFMVEGFKGRMRRPCGPYAPGSDLEGIAQCPAEGPRETLPRVAP